jgi:hypothetical protein
MRPSVPNSQAGPLRIIITYAASAVTVDVGRADSPIVAVLVVILDNDVVIVVEDIKILRGKQNRQKRTKKRDDPARLYDV